MLTRELVARPWTGALIERQFTVLLPCHPNHVIAHASHALAGLCAGISRMELQTDHEHLSAPPQYVAIGVFANRPGHADKDHQRKNSCQPKHHLLHL